MAKYATGKYAKAISDRSGMEFPYKEMLKEWNGSLVHISEFEPKQPQIRRRRTSADAIALQDIRPIKFQQPTNVSGVEADSGGASVGIANLTLPGDFAFSTQGTSAMKPANPSLQNRRRQLNALLGRVTVTV
jgi:hypothetical protein|tara:strand:+ start:1020 stop:1415 length:396 start_codon:yes stop_codon:yes gene_type:complete